MSSDATSDRSAADGYLQRARLLAELGRYDEAAAEVAYAVALEPENPEALTMLARVHLAAERPAEALTAADAAVAAAPNAVPPLVARGMALADLERYAESARTADQILALGPDDAYAQRNAAAILAGSRNGQLALNAAWRGVELAPEEPQAHLVLGLVAANMELFDLAERAYREALRLDPQLAEARHDIGVLRLEQRRWSDALEHLAEAAAMSPGRVDSGRTISAGVRQLVLYGAGWTMIAAVVIACMAPGGEGLSRVAATFAALGGALVVWRFAAKLPGLTRTILPSLLRSDRMLALAVYAAAGAPLLILLYALVGTPWPLVLAIAIAAAAELTVFSRAQY
ncbi:tetratricopeptide repeat protein [Micromonospora sp. C28SCA-DRY-2]|uniref:tetratricopeptide repeat protein n=1 Tax=Micromonospora sp. C28SCA-DRY-2 TaxID=3059522 RepID=UPI002674494F|nr:tetratricopeptide repeat protein [Micromonospora sp. C28SCA-DRY-2]MDO3703739.1 tetratricopeptide repeat protein [Micromonospora sp. C28SCA-DRY-2]